MCIRDRDTTDNRFRQVEERSLKELFMPNKNLNDKVRNEFYSEGHRRLSSPLLVIFMCTTAACTILFGKMRKKLSARKILAISALAIFIQSLYIGLICLSNNIPGTSELSSKFRNSFFKIIYLSLLLLNCLYQ